MNLTIELFQNRRGYCECNNNTEHETIAARVDRRFVEKIVSRRFLSLVDMCIYYETHIVCFRLF